MTKSDPSHNTPTSPTCSMADFPEHFCTKPVVEIEYCTGCRWQLRAAWTAQELLTTFENELGGVTLRPSPTSGCFQVRCGDQILHDRKTDNGFIELKQLKQRIRDTLFPSRDLGHSDA